MHHRMDKQIGISGKTGENNTRPALASLGSARQSHKTASSGGGFERGVAFTTRSRVTGMPIASLVD